MKKTQLFKSVSEILSICIFLSGSVVLIGWILDIPVLKSISPNFVAMKANTATCFILIGLSLWLSQTKRQGNRTVRRIARLCAFVVFLTGFLNKRAGIKPVGELTVPTIRKCAGQNWADYMPINVVKEWMGHSDISTTQEFYNQVDKGHEAKGIVADTKLFRHWT
jgi:integrase